MRNAKILQIFAGTDEMPLMAIARELLGRSLATVTPYPILQAQRDDYQRNGFITLRRLFTGMDITRFERDISATVARLQNPSAPQPPNSESSASSRAFTLMMNLWCHDKKVRAIVFNQTLASAAAQLMGVASVRLYHDHALHKTAHGGLTPWHCDQ